MHARGGIATGCLNRRGDGVTLLLGIGVRVVVRASVAVKATFAMLDTGEAKKTNIALGLEHNASLPLRPARVVAKENVELFERLLLGLGDKEPNVTNTEETHDSKENEDAVRSGSDKVGSRHADSKVVEPVGRGTNRDTLGTETEGEHFCYDNHSARAPANAERHDIDPDKDAGDPASGAVSRPVVSAGGDDDGDDHVTGAHDDGTGDQGRLTAPVVDVENGGDGGKEHDDTDDTRCKKRDRVAFETDLLKDERGIV